MIFYIKVSSIYKQKYIPVIRNLRENVSCHFANLKLKKGEIRNKNPSSSLNDIY